MIKQFHQQFVLVIFQMLRISQQILYRSRNTVSSFTLQQPIVREVYAIINDEFILIAAEGFYRGGLSTAG